MSRADDHRHGTGSSRRRHRFEGRPSTAASSSRRDSPDGYACSNYRKRSYDDGRRYRPSRCRDDPSNDDSGANTLPRKEATPSTTAEDLRDVKRRRGSDCSQPAAAAAVASREDVKESSEKGRESEKDGIRTEQPPPQTHEASPRVATGKVVFLTKKQRDELARRKEEQEKREQQQREKELQERRRTFLSAESLKSQPDTPHMKSNSSYHHPRGRRPPPGQEAPMDAGSRRARGDVGGGGYRRGMSESATTVPVGEEDTPHQQRASSPPQRAYTADTESTLSELQLLELRETEVHGVQNPKMLEQIRDHYLGLKKEKRKIQKPSEKFRNIFNFEWNPIEDTTRGDSNELYLSRVEPQLLFGRGFRAGIDVREQRRYNNFYDALVKHRGADETAATVRLDGTKAALIKPRDIESGDPNKKHWTRKHRDEMTDRDWRICREDFEIYIKGGRVPPPIRSWDESELPLYLLNAIRKIGYELPTPIQMQAIPIALAQRDLIGIAETGSGKTAAFVLPMITYVSSLPPLTDETSQDGPYALVLAPSRELAIQIDEETRKFAAFCQCRAIAVVGGRSAEAQAFELRRGAEIVIGTPGRIKDCLERAYTVLSQCNYVILDEADRMIDMGFEDIVNWILDQIPSTNLKSEDENQALQQELEAKAGYRKYRVTQMFSATMPVAVERLARKYLRSPAYVSIGDPGAGKRAIEQRIEFISDARKRQRLQEILEAAEPPVMIFVNQKKVADVLAKTLYKMGFSATSLHGGKAQDVREQSLGDFKSGDVDILVATDVAGRGIDVEGVQLVINFDMPKDVGSYTHRIGRTGRAGKKGVAISFCTEDDSGLFYDLRQLLISTNNVIPMELNNHPMAKVKPGTAGAPAPQSTTTGLPGSSASNGLIRYSS